MGVIVEKDVTMTAADWRKVAAEAREMAVRVINDDAGQMLGRSDALKAAAEYLTAATTYEGHANMLDMFDYQDSAKVDVWDLSDEEEPPEAAWPGVSAKLREIAGHNPKLLPLVDTIDRLHELAVEKGLPVVTKADLDAALADVPA